MGVGITTLLECFGSYRLESVFGLRVSNPWQVLVSTIFNRATSPMRAEQVAAVVVERWSAPETLAALHPCELEPLLRALPFARDKARAVVEAARAVRDRHDGQVPLGSEDLRLLPGVDRPGAGLILALAHGVPAIIADEHVQRVLHRIGWIAEEDPLAAEVALQTEAPPQAWVGLSAGLSSLGRSRCRPVVSRCQGCPLEVECPYVGLSSRPGRCDHNPSLIPPGNA